MKIAIIGGGSLGLLFAYYLSKDNEILLYTRTQEQSDKINKNGIHMIKSGREWTSNNVTAFPFDAWQGSVDLAIVTVKQYQLKSLMPKLKLIATKSLLFLQNGYGHISMLAELPSMPVYVGSVEHGAVRANGSTVYHNGEGITRVAVYKGSEKYLQNLSSLLSPEFPMLFEQDYEVMLIKKLVVNAVINPLTATLQVKNGDLIKNEFYFKIFAALFEECAKVLDLKNKEDYFRNLVNVCKKTADNHSSMYKDIENGRQTEVDAILGYLLEVAENKNMCAPLIQNYYQCIKGKEHEREGA